MGPAMTDGQQSGCCPWQPAHGMDDHHSRMDRRAIRLQQALGLSSKYGRTAAYQGRGLLCKARAVLHDDHSTHTSQGGPH
mmetsp:Transcript_10935/g.19532  ORF Transcript_10935/g.19532 Transcript_10935/m.19532 type:complete len:80 (-) Transcript_10935:902-1141(-)